jgi:receptor protein-tyrosine kinase
VHARRTLSAALGAATNEEPHTSVVLDLARLEQGGQLVRPETRSALAEQFRHIKQPLLRNLRTKANPDERQSLVMVTSALPREGKTFCAISLALSLAAEVDTSVLLVDADVLAPGVLQRLDVRADKGLLDVLQDPGLSLSDVVLGTNVSGLRLLPAGTQTTNSTELLASEAMEELLGSLAGDAPNRVVIFDAPPLLMTNEARVLASRVGQILLVVEAYNTPRSVVGQAFAAVEQCETVMVVLNRAPQPTIPLGYGYGYGYGVLPREASHPARGPTNSQE